MTDDEIVLWLITKGTMEDKPVLSFAADRILTLRAERDEMAMSCLSADGEAQRAWDAQKAAEAERDRLREALQLYADPCDATETSPCGYEGNMCCSTARAALKGETP